MLLFLHNPFGGYKTYYYNYSGQKFNIKSIWDYESKNHLVSWIETPLEFLGFLIPIVVFAIVWIYLFKDNKSSDHWKQYRKPKEESPEEEKKEQQKPLFEGNELNEFFKKVEEHEKAGTRPNYTDKEKKLLELLKKNTPKEDE